MRRFKFYIVLDPSPIPRYDVSKLNRSRALILFGAGREKKIYAVPPFTKAEPLTFEDVPFRTETFADTDGNRLACRRCGATDSFLDEFTTDTGEKVFQCSDSAYCLSRVQGFKPAQNMEAGNA